jgi:hypothetical protein
MHILPLGGAGAGAAGFEVPFPAISLSSVSGLFNCLIKYNWHFGNLPDVLIQSDLQLQNWVLSLHYFSNSVIFKQYRMRIQELLIQIKSKFICQVLQIQQVKTLQSIAYLQALTNSAGKKGMCVCR